MRYTRNKYIELCVKIESNSKALRKLRIIAKQNPALSFLGESTAKELVSDLKRLKRHIKSTGDYELASRLRIAIDSLVEDFIIDTAGSNRSLAEQMDYVELPISQYLLKISDIESDLSKWMSLQEQLQNAKNSKLLDGELLEGMTRSRFVCRVPENKLRIIFSSLYNQGYLNQKTTIVDWLIVCGYRYGVSKTIDWTKGQNELVYFIARMFAEENENDVWSITSRLFTVKGKMQNPDTLRVVNCKCNIKKEKKDKIDEILKIK